MVEGSVFISYSRDDLAFSLDTEASRGEQYGSASFAATRASS
jgi:hypothetical protein